MKTIFINSHPIQYLAPLYQYVTKNNLPVEVWYGSDASIAGLYDKEFGKTVKWDIDLLKGYTFRFFKNYKKLQKAPTSFWELWNPGMFWAILKEPKSIIIFNGWQFCMHILLALLAAIRGHHIYIRMEMPWKQEIEKKGFNQQVKKIAIKKYLQLFRGYLYIGQQNKLYYQHMGIKEEKLIFAPYCVDNERFHSFWQQHNQHKKSVRQQLHIPEDAMVILYSGKLIPKKRPLDLLKAFNTIQANNGYLIFMGDGELRAEMETIMQSNKTIITGFINQSLIPQYYTIADVFVMCSEMGETWGLSVNEAMNFSLPIIISDLTGCSDDLVENNVNGFVFETGNISALANCLETLIIQPQLGATMGAASLKKIQRYSYHTNYEALRQLT